MADMTDEPTPGVDTMNLVRTLCRKKATTALLVRAPERHGEIYFRSGRVVHASYGDLDGEDALFEMLAWRDARHQVIPLLELPETSIFSDLLFLKEEEPTDGRG